MGRLLDPARGDAQLPGHRHAAPCPKLGQHHSRGLANIFATSWPILAGGLAITIVVLAISIIGDQVRDELDPEIN
ncbi:hypothetical protein ACFSYD_21135 [Paracoccus aerius]